MTVRMTVMGWTMPKAFHSQEELEGHAAAAVIAGTQ